MDQARQPIFLDLTPLFVLPSKQCREARRLIKQAGRLWRDVLDEQRRGIYTSASKSKYEASRARLEAFAEAALRDAVGIEPYMVLDICRHNGHRNRLQVESVAIADDLFGLSKDGLAWILDGRNVRKDGSLGQQNETAYLGTAYIERRCLDGIWRPLAIYSEGADAL